MAIDKNEDKFWQDFEKHLSNNGIHTKIAKDGILNPSKFDRNNGILFILKETNGYAKPLSELLEDGPRHQMWHTLSRWAYGLQNPDIQFHTLTKSQLTEALHKVAVINLKKIPGKAVAKPSEILAAAKRDHQFLLKQIKCINPKLIITCKTFIGLRQILAIKDVDKKVKTYTYNDDSLNCNIIAWIHPNRKNSKITYEEL
jgi:hypothetical protein